MAMEQVKHAKDKGTTSLENAYTISTNLTVSVEDGAFGRYIQIKRDGRWICLSASLWKLVQENLDKLRTIGQIVYLTKVKRMEVINYKDNRYVSFVQVSLYQGIDYKYYINFNDDEWTTLLEIIVKINNMLFSEEKQKPYDCRGIKRSIPSIKDKYDEPESKRNDYKDMQSLNLLTEDKQTKKAKISKKKLAKILASNAGVDYCTSLEICEESQHGNI
jgi:hypothetical protein